MSVLANTWAGNVESGTGADQVGIVIEGCSVAAGASEGLNVDAGTGADQVGIIVNYDLTAGAAAALAVNGGDGADQVGIIIDYDVAAGASLRVNVDTGLDPDTIYFNSERGMVAAGASFAIGVDSGSGNDFVFGHFGLDPESRGVIAIIFQGGSGDDDLTLDISGIGDPNLLNAHLDGGDGFDVAHVSRNVEVINCEEVFFF
jgi:hypothetical protein